MSPRPGVQFAFPPLTSAAKWLIAINVGVFFLNIFFGGGLIDWLGLSWEKLVEFWGLGSIRLITSQFVHSYTDPWHLIFNMVFGLYFFGTMVEGEVGRKGLVKLYLLSGLVGAGLQLIMSLAMSIDPTMVGASGACYGIIVYAACMAPRARTMLFGIELRWLVGVLVLVGVYMMLLELRHGVADNVAHGAHVGGALWGWVAFKWFRVNYITADQRPFFAPLARLAERIRRRRAARRAREAAQRDASVDAVLEKVHRQGLSSLTPAERRILDRASEQAKRR